MSSSRAGTKLDFQEVGLSLNIKDSKYQERSAETGLVLGTCICPRTRLKISSEGWQIPRSKASSKT